MNLLKRAASALVAGSTVFAVLYLGARYEQQWTVGFLLLIVAYLAAFVVFRIFG